MTEKFTQLYLPKGEWLDATLTAFKRADLELQSTPRCYEYTFVSSRIPIVFQAIRSKEVWSDISDPETVVDGGFTGSDIVLEQMINPTRRWLFPLNELKPENADFPNPRIYIGSTPNFRNQATTLDLGELETRTIYTSYPNITRSYFRQLGISPTVIERQGTIEGRWRSNPNNWAIVDVVSTGKTLEANEIKIMDYIMSARLEYIEGENMNPQDKLRVDDLIETLENAKSKLTSKN